MVTKRVLIIDDEPDVQAVVRGCLEEIAGWEVISAPSGQEGLVQVLVHRPDAVILDVMMPGMDGLGFLKALRRYTPNTDLPVVLLTAKVNLPEAGEFAALGAQGVIAKPFDPFALVEQLSDFLGWPIEP